MMEDDLELAEVGNNQATDKENGELEDKQFDSQVDPGQVRQ